MAGDSSSGAILPSAPGNEAGALGAVMLAGDEAGDLLDQLDDSHFTDPKHKEVFRSLLAIQEDSLPLTVDSVAQHLAENKKLTHMGGALALNQLLSQAPTAIQFPVHLRALDDMRERRARLVENRREYRILLDTSKPVNGRPIRKVWGDLVEDGADIVSQELSAVTEIVAGLVADRSKFVICSGSKCFKTWVTIDLALSIASGAHFFGRQTIQMRVLYVNLELKPDTFRRRVQAITSARGFNLKSGWFQHVALRGKLASCGLEMAVTNIVQLAKHFEAGVVVLDPVYKLNTIGDENSSRDQTIFFNQLDRITTEAGATVILNDHAGKGNQSEKDPLDVIRGSSAKGGDLDAAMVLRRHEVEECFRVDVVHRELPPVSPFVIGWRYPVMVVRTDLDAAGMRSARSGRRPTHDPKVLLTAISETTVNNPISISGWAEVIGMPRTTLADYARSFLKNGWIRTVGDGKSAKQYITPAGLQQTSRTG